MGPKQLLGVFVPMFALGCDGDAGDMGEVGEMGEPGDQGEPGDPGEPGEQGDQGVPGGQGEMGLPGTDGIDGIDGIDGNLSLMSGVCNFSETGGGMTCQVTCEDGGIALAYAGVETTVETNLTGSAQSLANPSTWTFTFSVASQPSSNVATVVCFDSTP